MRAGIPALFSLLLACYNDKKAIMEAANMAKGQGRSYNQRLKLFHLLDYLMENTDMEPGHTVKTSKIVEYLNNIEVPVEKKTVVTDIHLLQEYGVEIEYD